jgi:hypothetical protein
MDLAPFGRLHLIGLSEAQVEGVDFVVAHRTLGAVLVRMLREADR